MDIGLPLPPWAGGDGGGGGHGRREGSGGSSHWNDAWKKRKRRKSQYWVKSQMGKGILREKREGIEPEWKRKWKVMRWELDEEKRVFVWRKKKGGMDKVRGIWVVHKQIRIAKDFSNHWILAMKIKIKMMIYSICCTCNLSFLQSCIILYYISIVLYLHIFINRNTNANIVWGSNKVVVV